MESESTRIAAIKVVDTTTIQLDEKCAVDYHVNFMSEEFADEMFAELSLTIPWRTVVRAGKDGPLTLPRLQCWMSYPGVDAQLYQKEPALPWSPSMLKLKSMIETALREQGVTVEFDYVLMNYYRDGNDKIGFHSDDEAYEENKKTIASISLGATRNFRMVAKRKKAKPKYDFNACHGSLIVMRGDTQFHWLHGIPGDSTVTTPRINLTFRKS